MSVNLFTIRTRKLLQAVSFNGKRKFFSAEERLNREWDYGRYRPDSWSLGETINDAATRETLEEAQAVAQIDELFAIYNIPHVSQVYVIFRAHLETPDFSPGEESLEARLFAEDEIPWDELAFQVVRESLLQYFECRRINDLRPFVDHIIR